MEYGKSTHATIGCKWSEGGYDIVDEMDVVMDTNGYQIVKSLGSWTMVWSCWWGRRSLRGVLLRTSEKWWQTCHLNEMKIALHCVIWHSTIGFICKLKFWKLPSKVQGCTQSWCKASEKNEGLWFPEALGQFAYNVDQDEGRMGWISRLTSAEHEYELNVRKWLYKENHFYRLEGIDVMKITANQEVTLERNFSGTALTSKMT